MNDENGKHEFNFFLDKQLQQKLLDANEDLLDKELSLALVSGFRTNGVLVPSNSGSSNNKNAGANTNQQNNNKLPSHSNKYSSDCVHMCGWCPDPNLVYRKTETDPPPPSRSRGSIGGIPRDSIYSRDSKTRPQNILNFVFRHYTDPRKYIEQYRKEHACIDSTNSSATKSEFLETRRFYAYNQYSPLAVPIGPNSAYYQNQNSYIPQPQLDPPSSHLQSHSDTNNSIKHHQQQQTPSLQYTNRRDQKRNNTISANLTNTHNRQQLFHHQNKLGKAQNTNKNADDVRDYTEEYVEALETMKTQRRPISAKEKSSVHGFVLQKSSGTKTSAAADFGVKGVRTTASNFIGNGNQDGAGARLGQAGPSTVKMLDSMTTTGTAVHGADRQQSHLPPLITKSNPSSRTSTPDVDIRRSSSATTITDNTTTNIIIKTDDVTNTTTNAIPYNHNFNINNSNLSNAHNHNNSAFDSTSNVTLTTVTNPQLQNRTSTTNTRVLLPATDTTEITRHNNIFVPYYDQNQNNSNSNHHHISSRINRHIPTTAPSSTTTPFGDRGEISQNQKQQLIADHRFNDVIIHDDLECLGSDSSSCGKKSEVSIGQLSTTCLGADVKVKSNSNGVVKSQQIKLESSRTFHVFPDEFHNYSHNNDDKQNYDLAASSSIVSSLHQQPNKLSTKTQSKNGLPDVWNPGKSAVPEKYKRSRKERSNTSAADYGMAAGGPFRSSSPKPRSLRRPVTEQGGRYSNSTNISKGEERGTSVEFVTKEFSQDSGPMNLSCLRTAEMIHNRSQELARRAMTAGVSLTSSMTANGALQLMTNGGNGQCGHSGLKTNTFKPDLPSSFSLHGVSKSKPNFSAFIKMKKKLKKDREKTSFGKSSGSTGTHSGGSYNSNSKKHTQQDSKFQLDRNRRTGHSCGTSPVYDDNIPSPVENVDGINRQHGKRKSYNYNYSYDISHLRLKPGRSPNTTGDNNFSFNDRRNSIQNQNQNHSANSGGGHSSPYSVTSTPTSATQPKSSSTPAGGASYNTNTTSSSSTSAPYFKFWNSSLPHKSNEGRHRNAANNNNGDEAADILYNNNGGLSSDIDLRQLAEMMLANEAVASARVNGSPSRNKNTTASTTATTSKHRTNKNNFCSANQDMTFELNQAATRAHNDIVEQKNNKRDEDKQNETDLERVGSDDRQDGCAGASGVGIGAAFIGCCATVRFWCRVLMFV